jgi:hypothetical protein
MDIDMNDPPPKRFHELDETEQVFEMATALAAAERWSTVTAGVNLRARFAGLHHVTREAYLAQARPVVRAWNALEVSSG